MHSNNPIIIMTFKLLLPTIGLFIAHSMKSTGVTSNINDVSVPLSVTVSLDRDPACTMPEPWYW